MPKELDNLNNTTVTDEDDDAAFEAAYSGDDPSPIEPEVDADKPADSTAAAAVAGTDKPADKTAAPAAKPAAAAEPDRFDAFEKRVQNWMREQGGVIGGMKDQITRMGAAAKTAATAAGAPSPTKDQIEAATKSAEKWDKLKTDYPEWGEAFEGQINLVEQRILSKIPQVDADAIKSDAVKASSATAQTGIQQIEEVIPLYVKHPDWKETTKSPEFKTWALTGGPSVEEYDAYNAIPESEPAKAGEALNELIRKYPNWWSEKGSKLIEGSIKDSISLLDTYSEAAQAAANSAPADKGRQTKRLEAAITPTSGATRQAVIKNDQQEFEDAYNS